MFIDLSLSATDKFFTFILAPVNQKHQYVYLSWQINISRYSSQLQIQLFIVWISVQLNIEHKKKLQSHIFIWWYKGVGSAGSNIFILKSERQKYDQISGKILQDVYSILIMKKFSTSQTIFSFDEDKFFFSKLFISKIKQE